jgi:hypothetical protein
MLGLFMIKHKSLNKKIERPLPIPEGWHGPVGIEGYIDKSR